MALGAGGRRFFRFILFIELFVAILAIGVQRFGVVFLYFFLFGKLLCRIFALGRFSRCFVTLDAFLNVIAVF